MFSFGSGVLFGTRTDIANATPVNFGLVQEVTIDETATIKELYGQFQHPVAIARGSVKTTGKAKAARVSGLALGSLFYGVTPTAGQIAMAFAEAAAVPAASPFTVTPANATTFLNDTGVIYAATGLPLTFVAPGSTPTVGQYTTGTGGTYAFAAADTGKALLLNYTYTLANAGQQIYVTNQLMGTTPTFGMRFYTTFQNQPIHVTYFNCTSNKFGFASKLEDFVMPEFDFSCFADAAGNVCRWNFGEVS